MATMHSQDTRPGWWILDAFEFPNVTAVNGTLPLCPVQPPNLVGPIEVKTIPPSWKELEKRYQNLDPGGRWRPSDCTSRHHVAIIVPYRDRKSHLRVFLNNLHDMLQKQQLDYGIYVIEQTEGPKFNRAKLFNTGFVEALKRYAYSCFIFHDVDEIPENDHIIYSCSESPRHMNVARSKTNYKLEYAAIFRRSVRFFQARFSQGQRFLQRILGLGKRETMNMYASRMLVNLWTQSVLNVTMISGDFCQILPVIAKGTRADAVNACIKSSYLWSKNLAMDDINSKLLEQLPGDPTSYKLMDTVPDPDQVMHYPTEFLNSLAPSGNK
ncbi:PREDICTED: beta-1,4-N-acetylgalactosaminyltransferase bre-4-like [Priapulus caudatus]|uniref:Multifunctional fusion protein n=1 Tax=Priapulus caudatus TaxID=37621 RepID=A0ABM1ENC1_PRICU|nr:PREDICTED: beta-1,4-N-acetylgalactosaminyltransferase bre-4-like [Priapulus caudatus]